MNKKSSIIKKQRICSDDKCRQFGCFHHGEHIKNEYCDENCTHNTDAKCEVI